MRRKVIFRIKARKTNQYYLKLIYYYKWKFIPCRPRESAIKNSFSRI